MSKSTEYALGIWLYVGVLGIVGLLFLIWTAFLRPRDLVRVPVIAAVIAYTFYVAAAFLAGAELPKFLRDHLFDGLAPAAAVGFLVNSMSLHNPRTALRWIRRPVMVPIVLSAGAALIFGAIGALAIFSSGSDNYGKPVGLSALFGLITFFTWYFVIVLPYSYSETLSAWIRWWFRKRAEPAGNDQENGYRNAPDKEEMSAAIDASTSTPPASRRSDREFRPLPVLPRVAALLAGLTLLAEAVIVLIVSFNAVHWTSAQITLVATEVAAFWAFAVALTAHLWPLTKAQPVGVASTLTAFGSVTLSLGIGFAWWQLTQSQNATLIGLVTAIIAAATALLAQSALVANVRSDLGFRSPFVPPRIAALLAGLTTLTGTVIGLIVSFNAVHWTSAQIALVAMEFAAFWALAAAVTAHLWPQTKKQPAALAGTLTAFVSITLSLGMGFAWWQLTQSQNAALISLVTAIVAAATALVAQRTVTAATTPAGSEPRRPRGP